MVVNLSSLLTTAAKVDVKLDGATSIIASYLKNCAKCVTLTPAVGVMYKLYSHTVLLWSVYYYWIPASLSPLNIC